MEERESSGNLIIPGLEISWNIEPKQGFPDGISLSPLHLQAKGPNPGCYLTPIAA